MDITITTPATLTSIDKVLVKANKRISHTLEDTLIDFWISAADQYIEKAANISLMQQTITLRIEKVLPTIQLPRPPLISLTSLKYTLDSDDIETTVNVSTGVTIRNENMLPTIDITALEDEADADGFMVVVYTAGYATAASVPAPLRQAALLLASHYVTSREAIYLDPRAFQVERKIAFGVDALISEYRVQNSNIAINGGF